MHHSRLAWSIVAALLLGHAVSGVVLDRTASAENIDCYTFQRDAVQTLLHGHNPYGGTQANIYAPAETRMYYGPGIVVDGRVQVGLQYPPLTLLWAMPGYLLGDVRYSYLLADLIAAVVCFLMVPGTRGLLLAVFLLVNPIAYQVENRCWTEPMVFMALCVTLYAARRKSWWLPIALGLFLATKQYNLVALPFLAFLAPPFRWKTYLSLLGRSLAVAAATLLPFAWPHPRALWHDLVVFHLAQPFRPDALSVAVIWPVFLKLGPLLLLAFVVWVLWVARPSPAMFAVAYATCVLLLFATGKQAFGNYYFLIGQTLVVAAAAFPVNQSDRGFTTQAV